MHLELLPFTAMEKARTRHREALEELKRLMQEERENALFDLEEKWKNDNNLLTTSLADHLMELNLVREELNRLKAELTSREKGFGSVSDSLGQVKEELTRVKRNLASANRDKDHLDKENHSLNVSLSVTVHNDAPYVWIPPSYTIQPRM